MFTPVSLGILIALTVAFVVSGVVALVSRFDSLWRGVGIGGLFVTSAGFVATLVTVVVHLGSNPFTSHMSEVVGEQFPVEKVAKAAGLPVGAPLVLSDTLSQVVTLTGSADAPVNLVYTQSGPNWRNVYLACESDLPDVGGYRYRWRDAADAQFDVDFAAFLSDARTTHCRVDTNPIGVDATISELAPVVLSEQVAMTIRNRAIAVNVDAADVRTYGREETVWVIDGAPMSCKGSLPTVDEFTEHLDGSLPQLWNDKSLEAAIEKFNFASKVKVECAPRAVGTPFKTS